MLPNYGKIQNVKNHIGISVEKIRKGLGTVLLLLVETLEAFEPLANILTGVIHGSHLLVVDFGGVLVGKWEVFHWFYFKLGRFSRKN